MSDLDLAQITVAEHRELIRLLEQARSIAVALEQENAALVDRVLAIVEEWEADPGPKVSVWHELAKELLVPV